MKLALICDVNISLRPLENYMRTPFDEFFVMDGVQLVNGTDCQFRIAYLPTGAPISGLLDEADEAVFIWKGVLDDVKWGIRYCIQHQIPYRIFAA